MRNIWEKLLEVISGVLVATLYIWWFSLYWLWLYHVNDKHDKEMLLAVMTPWAFYRWAEYFWHKEDRMVWELKEKKEVEVAKSNETMVWIDYESPDKKFSVKLPGIPEVTSANKLWVKTITYFSVDKDWRAFYKIEYTTLPDSLDIDIKTYADMYLKWLGRFNVTKNEIKNQTWIFEGSPPVLGEWAEDIKNTFKWYKNAKIKTVSTIIGTVVYSRIVTYDATLDSKYLDIFFDSFKFSTN